MKKNTIRIIILLTTTSLLGIIFTQLFWIRNAVDLSEKQFDHRVTVALNEVLEEIARMNNILVTIESDTILWNNSSLSFHSVIDTIVLDSLLKERFESFYVDTNFVYKIVNCKDKAEFTVRDGIYSDRFTVSRHKACLSCIWDNECYNLVVIFPMKRKFVLVDMTMWLVVSFAFILVVILSFLYIIKVIIQQKKVSEIKNDFVNNMTHEFKTPLATISMASEILLKIDDDSKMERVQKYSRIIFDENQRLKNQVERVLQIAALDKGDFQLDLVQTDINQMIKDTTEKVCLNHCNRPVDLTYEFSEETLLLSVDKLHIKNIISNLVENAYKYSRNDPEIIISTQRITDAVQIIVEDKGIGMNSDTQKQIFEKFFRLHTGDIHDVKGFGLGLHYVKTMVEAHKGNIKVESELNKGSRFIVTLPDFKY